MAAYLVVDSTRERRVSCGEQRARSRSTGEITKGVYMKVSALLFATLILLVIADATSPSFAQQSIATKPAVPVAPIAAILDAFRSDAIVALGDNHGNEQGHAFRLSLIRDPRFAAAVND